MPPPSPLQAFMDPPIAPFEPLLFFSKDSFERCRMGDDGVFDWDLIKNQQESGTKYCNHYIIVHPHIPAVEASELEPHPVGHDDGGNT